MSIDFGFLISEKRFFFLLQSLNIGFNIKMFVLLKKL